MDVRQVKYNIGRQVSFDGRIYTMTACIMRQGDRLEAHMIDWIVLVIGIAIGFFTGVFAGEAYVQRGLIEMIVDALMDVGEEDEDE